jgi:hypothetical protein
LIDGAGIDDGGLTFIKKPCYTPPQYDCFQRAAGKRRDNTAGARTRPKAKRAEAVPVSGAYSSLFIFEWGAFFLPRFF